MRDFLSQAEKAIEAYRDRGDIALKCISDHEMEMLEEVLLARKAAFYNFKVADQLALDQGADVSELPKFQKIWQRIQEQEVELSAKLEKLVLQTGEKVSKSASVRRNVGRYHSGKLPETKIVKSV